MSLKGSRHTQASNMQFAVKKITQNLACQETLSFFIANIVIIGT
jgi:hypothetical protein